MHYKDLVRDVVARTLMVLRYAPRTEDQDVEFDADEWLEDEDVGQALAQTVDAYAERSLKGGLRLLSEAPDESLEEAVEEDDESSISFKKYVTRLLYMTLLQDAQQDLDTLVRSNASCPRAVYRPESTNNQMWLARPIDVLVHVKEGSKYSKVATPYFHAQEGGITLHTRYGCIYLEGELRTCDPDTLREMCSGGARACRTQRIYLVYSGKPVLADTEKDLRTILSTAIGEEWVSMRDHEYRECVLPELQVE